MRKLSLDISTRATGIVIQNDNEVPVQYKLILAEGKDTLKRIREMCNKIFDYIAKQQFDIVIVSKATHRFSQQIIMLVEGMVLGEAVKRNIKFDYFPDIAWYSKMEGTRVYDERYLKKKKSLRRFIYRHNLQDDILKAEEKQHKIFVHLKNGELITDDIADAFNAGDLYEKRMIDYKVKADIEKAQKEINNLLWQNKKIRRKIKILNGRIKFFIQEKNEFIKQYKINKSGKTLFSAKTRHKRVIACKKEKMQLEVALSANLSTIEKKRAARKR